MSAAYDPTTDVGLVRLGLSDVDDGNFIFTDAEINAFLNAEGGDVDLATARGLMVLASNEVLLLKYIQTHGLTVDGSRVARELRENAKQLREDAATVGDEALLTAKNNDGYDFAGQRRVID